MDEDGYEDGRDGESEETRAFTPVRDDRPRMTSAPMVVVMIISTPVSTVVSTVPAGHPSCSSQGAV